MDYLIETFVYHIFHISHTQYFHVSATLYIVDITLQLRVRLTPLTELSSSPPQFKIFRSRQIKDPTKGLQEYNTGLSSNTMDRH